MHFWAAKKRITYVAIDCGGLTLSGIQKPPPEVAQLELLKLLLSTGTLRHFLLHFPGYSIWIMTRCVATQSYLAQAASAPGEG
ncbi:unnamed protein product [Gongylonema pulchrum]|uniref:STAS domain-containing protein n=1 Tax=Gongylonema pulchrum TaxID=637853 RepID=A0A183CVQ7_9BILA|nr:unnamed protein product [Gongylonema pulchrum]